MYLGSIRWRMSNPEYHSPTFTPPVHIFYFSPLTRWYVPPPRSLHFIRVVHTTGGLICGYNHLAKHTCPSTTVKDSYAMCHTGKMSNTSTHFMLLYYTKRGPSHDLMYIVEHTFGHRSKKFICACTESSTHAHSTKSVVEILNILKLL